MWFTVCVLLPFSVFTYNGGSAVLLRASQAIISDSIRFQKNRAYRGAALNINDGSRVSIYILCFCKPKQKHLTTLISKIFFLSFIIRHYMHNYIRMYCIMRKLSRDVKFVEFAVSLLSTKF